MQPMTHPIGYTTRMRKHHCPPCSVSGLPGEVHGIVIVHRIERLGCLAVLKHVQTAFVSFEFHTPGLPLLAFVDDARRLATKPRPIGHTIEE